MAQKKTYTEEQKAEILKKASETSITEASKEFGVDRKTIRSWKASDSLAADAIEAKKKTRAAGRKVKDALTTTAEKAAGDVKEAAEKAVTVEQIEVGKVKAKQTRKAAEKKAVKDEKAAVKAAKKETKAAQKPAAKLKTVKLNMVFQSPWGSEITPEQVALKVPKEATDVYVKIDENKIYWVGKNGETGALDIW